MDTTSVAYVLCRIEDDASLSPISEHEDICAGVAAGNYQVEVEDLDFSYALYAEGVKVASFAEGRIGYCQYQDCGRIISLARPHPEGRKPRSDKKFCDDACRQAHHRSKKRTADKPS